MDVRAASLVDCDLFGQSRSKRDTRETMSMEQRRTNRPFNVGVCLAALLLTFEYSAWPEPEGAEFSEFFGFRVLLGLGLIVVGVMAAWAKWRGDKVEPNWWLGALTILGITILCGAWLIPWLQPGSRIKRSKLAIGISNCRKIDIALKTYAEDHGGKYPDAAMEGPRSSHEIFRKLVAEGYLDDELVFGCPFSPAAPDGNPGQAPDYLKAVKAGENHWAMRKGLTDESPPDMPLVFENPAVATWQPKWNADAVVAPLPGRVWRSLTVIVGFNDGSVSPMPLAAKKGSAVGLAPKADGSLVFPDLHPTPEILDIAR